MKNIKYLSSRAKALILAGALALAGTTTACSKDAEPTVELTTEVTTEANEINDSNQNVINNINDIEKNIVELTNNQLLPNGVVEITEENKNDKVEFITNSYITFNLGDIDSRTLGTINQNGELDSATMTKDFVTFVATMSDGIAVSNNENKIEVESLFAKDENGEIKDKNDYEYLKQYVDLVANYNQAIKDGNAELTKQYLDELIGIKEAIITDQNVVQDINPQTLFMVADSMILLDNVVTDEDTKIQLVNSIEEACTDKVVTTGEVDNTMNQDASQGSYESRFESITEDILVAKFLQANSFVENCDSNYSYSMIVSRISSQLDLSRYKGKTVSEEYVEQENARQQQIVDSESSKRIGTTTTTVSPDQVPEDKKEGTTETVTDNDGKVVELTEEEYIEAWNAGDAQATADYNARTRTDRPSVAGKSAKWNEVYSKSYNATYDGFVKFEQDFKRGNVAGSNQARTDYGMGIRNTNPRVDGESDAFNNGYIAGYNSTYDDLVYNSSLEMSLNSLKQLKEAIMTYSESYEVASNDVKKM